MSMLTLIADKIVPRGLALIDCKLVSVLTLIADKIVSMFGIDSLQACVRVDIDRLQACVRVDIDG